MGNAKKWSEEEINFLKENSSMPLEEISSILNRSLNSITYAYHTFKIPRSLRHRLLKEEKEFITSNFQNLTNEDLAARFKVKKQTIVQFLIRNNLKRDRSNHVQYFDRLCTEDYAYVLGWLCSDGSLSWKYRRLTLSLTEADGLEIKDAMMNIYDWKIRLDIRSKRTNCKPQIVFSASKKDILLFFRDRWEFETKSLGINDVLFNYIESSSLDCQRCFLRGFMDGDGHVRKCHMGVVFCKHLDYDWTPILSLIPKNIKVYPNVQRSSRGNGSLLSIFKDSPLFFQYIYNTKFKTCLSRKRDVVLAHFEKPYYRDKYGPLINE